MSENEPNSSKKLSLEEFVSEIKYDSDVNTDSKYIFFLGAGCSKSSGIPLASELAKGWYKELKTDQRQKFDKFNEEYKIEDEIEESDTSTFAKHYFDIFEKLFPTSISQQKAIQKLTKEKKPSIGYYILATLMQKPQFDTIITTNFDDLIQDALIYSANTRASVITHQNLAHFIDRDDTPMIIKIHGDAHLQPFNNSSDTKKLPKEWKTKIAGQFTNAKVIFIGYGGGDESISDLLDICSQIDQVYWLNATEPTLENKCELSKWWEESTESQANTAYIEEQDFDKIMLAIKNKFELSSPDFEKFAKDLKDAYDISGKEEIKKIEKINTKNKTALDYLLLGNSYGNNNEYDKAIESYSKAIKINPNSTGAYYNMGIVYGKLAQYDKAIETYNRVIKLIPNYCDAYYNIGFIYGQLKKYDKAIEYYQKTIEFEFNHLVAYYNMGISYGMLKKYDKGIEAYKKLLGFDPNYRVAYTNLFELELITKQSFDKELELKFIELFKDKKRSFIQYEMLKILELIVNHQEADIKAWQEKYSDITIDSWLFKELNVWLETIEDKEIKNKLKNAIEVFEKHDNSVI